MCLNEFQIASDFKEDDVTFKKLMSLFLRDIRQVGYNSIRTHVNKLKRRSQRLIEHVAFQQVGETERGYQFTIGLEDFMKRLGRILGNLLIELRWGVPQGSELWY